MMSSNMGELVTPMTGAGKPTVQKRLAKLARKYAEGGKVGLVMGEFKRGKLRSGSKKGPKVTNRKQAIAIALSEKRRQMAGKYASGGPTTGWWRQLQSEIQALTPKSPLQRGSEKANEGQR